MNDDLDYVWLAPSLQWRGEKVFTIPAYSAAPLQMGHIDVLPDRPAVKISSRPKRVPRKRQVPVR